MKKLILFLSLSLVSLVSFGQNFRIDSLYQNISSSEKLIYSNVNEFPNLKRDEIKNLVKNWASTSFVSLKDVIVSETDDQLVLVYITKSMYVKSLGIKTSFDWYIRLVCQFKDGRAKFSFYDDGNVAILPTRGQYYSSPGMAARTIYLENYFKEDGTARNMYVNGLRDLKYNVVQNIEEIKKAQTAIKVDNNW